MLLASRRTFCLVKQVSIHNYCIKLKPCGHDEVLSCTTSATLLYKTISCGTSYFLFTIKLLFVEKQFHCT